MEFVCVKITTHRGRLVRVGTKINVREAQAKAFSNNKCWEPVTQEKQKSKARAAAKTADIG